MKANKNIEPRPELYEHKPPFTTYHRKCELTCTVIDSNDIIICVCQTDSDAKKVAKALNLMSKEQ